MRIDAVNYEKVAACFDAGMRDAQQIADRLGISKSNVSNYTAKYRQTHPDFVMKNTKKTKKPQEVRERCKKCFYRRETSRGISTCDYILIEGHSRGCDAENCDKYLSRAQAKKQGKKAPRYEWG